MLDQGERHQPAEGQQQCDPEVQPHPQDVNRIVDPEVLLEQPEGRVARHV